jgi:hypothetical protein
VEIRAKEEARRRAAVLNDLQSALAAQGVSSVLARYHRLVLGGGSSKCEPSGPTDPQLHIFTPDGTDIATARGSTYHFASGHAHPADDPARAALRLKARNGREQPAPASPLAATDEAAR